MISEPYKHPQDRSEQEQREMERLKRYRDDRSDAPAPVMMFERGDLP